MSGEIGDRQDQRLALERQLAAKRQLRDIISNQLAYFPPGSAPPEKVLQLRELEQEIREIEDQIDGLPAQVVESRPLMKATSLQDTGVEQKPAPPTFAYHPDVLRITKPIAMEFVRVPAGEFLMGSDPDRDKEAQYDEQPQHRVYVSEFYIDRYPVTNAQYAAFVQASGYKSEGEWKQGAGKNDHPVVNISWNDAVVFCGWLSEASGYVISLPSEAEWEKAARGVDGRIYPWGDDFHTRKANTTQSGTRGTTRVGQYSPGGDSPYGAADMIGNVWEWCADGCEDEDDYKSRGNQVVQDPTGPAKGKYRVLRGGSWRSEPQHARCAARNSGFGPFFRNDHWGFRVACAPPSSDL